MPRRAMGRPMARFFPSPMAYAILLTLIAFVGAWWVGDLGPGELLDAWASGDAGFWSFLGFAMQMTLVLVTGTVVAESDLSRALLKRLAALPRDARQATILVALVASCTALVHWGLGLIVGAVLAREVGRTATARGMPVHYPTLAAGGYCGLLVWHGGLSGSAPLKVTTTPDLVDVLGPELAARVGALPLTETVFSLRNILVTGALVLLMPAVLAALVPSDAARYVPPPEEPSAPSESPAGSPLDRGPWLIVPLVVLMGLWIVRWIASGGLWRLSPNTLNFVFFALGLALAGSPARYMELAGRGASAATGILVQFPLYAGIRGLLVVSGLGKVLASFGSASLLVSTFLAAGLLNFFIPSGGGQWGIQGPVAMAEAVEQGIEPARIVLAVAWGDQWTNAFQPFWALPLLGITRAKASDLLACTAVVGLVAGAVMLVGVVL